MGVRADLPETAVVGYLTDADPSLVSTIEEYYLAEHALIPRVIANNTNQRLVLANVRTPQPPAFYQSRGLDLVKDYGNGVMLLKRGSR